MRFLMLSAEVILIQKQNQFAPSLGVVLPPILLLGLVANIVAVCKIYDKIYIVKYLYSRISNKQLEGGGD
jgi:hypothetical protein